MISIIVNTRSRQSIFFCAWVVIICQRVFSGQWRSLCTRNLAPSRSLTPQRLHHPKSEGCERCRYVCCDCSCSPTVPVVMSHIRVDKRSRGASDDCYTCCRRLLPHSLLRHASNVTRILWHGTFGILWKANIVSIIFIM